MSSFAAGPFRILRATVWESPVFNRQVRRRAGRVGVAMTDK
jgi:hypothetical protein